MNPRTVGALALLLAAGAVPVAAQSRRCLLELENVDRELVTNKVTDSTENYFAGGSVRLKCRGQEVRMWADSVASYQGLVVFFVGNFKYEDSSATVTADFGTWYKDNERFEARGNVNYRNRTDGSTLVGPSVDYFREIPDTRPKREVAAELRPTLTLAARAGQGAESYVVVADRIRMRGEDETFAGGTVTIDRSDVQGRGDSLALDTGAGSRGVLLARRPGRASIRRIASDSFRLTAPRIDLDLDARELSFVTGRDSALLVSRSLDLAANTIGLDLQHRKVVQTLAWGAPPRRPVAQADDYEIRADSLAIDTPDERLQELRAFGGAWVGFRPDTAQGERDWLAGKQVTAAFVPSDSAGEKRAALRRLEAREEARSFYRIRNAVTGRPTINYSRARRITLTFAPGDSLRVERVDMAGDVDGAQLEPGAARRDTATVARPSPRQGGIPR